MSAAGPRPATDVSGPVWLSAGLTVLLVGATLGEGGARPAIELAIHGFVVVLLVGVLLVRPGSGPRLDAFGPLGAYAVFFVLAFLGAALAPYPYAAWEALVAVGLFAAVAWLAGRCGPVLVTMLAPTLVGVAAVQSMLTLFQRFAEGASSRGPERTCHARSAQRVRQALRPRRLPVPSASCR